MWHEGDARLQVSGDIGVEIGLRFSEVLDYNLQVGMSLREDEGVMAC